MCFLAGISNSNVSNELEKSSDWERLGISKLKNNPNLKEANEGVPQKCTFECFTLQNVEPTDCNVSFAYYHSVSLPCFFLYLLSPLVTLTSLFLPPYHLCSYRHSTVHITLCWIVPLSEVRGSIKDRWSINESNFLLKLGSSARGLRTCR